VTEEEVDRRRTSADETRRVQVTELSVSVARTAVL
jgi:hypothetical protein